MAVQQAPHLHHPLTKGLISHISGLSELGHPLQHRPVHGRNDYRPLPDQVVERHVGSAPGPGRAAAVAVQSWAPARG
ncbi:hypothetical protein [Microbispora sp. NPDC049633]|uniref:hypothetical protein n=1 Tax=Microbispora sp. NPDC049633 TaxID=3154355 RepID=UPI00344775B8